MLNLKSGAYSWIYGGMFIGALGAVVAVATVSSRPPVEAKAADTTSLPTESKSTPLFKSNIKKGEGIQWAPDFESAMQQARVEKKPILIDFYTDWCSACKIFNREVLPKKEVIAESANWVTVHINGDKRPDVAQAYGVTGYPTFIFAENTGKPISVMPGYMPDVDFAKVMRTARSKWEHGVS